MHAGGKSVKEKKRKQKTQNLKKSTKQTNKSPTPKNPVMVIEVNGSG